MNMPAPPIGTTFENRAIPPTLYATDITNLDPNRLVNEHFAKGETCNLVLGGPPCFGFSVHRINDAGVGDSRNNLVLRYFEFVSSLRPRVFLMENVPGILWDRHKDYLDGFYERGKDLDIGSLPPEYWMQGTMGHHKGENVSSY